MSNTDVFSGLIYGWPKGTNDWNVGMDANLQRIGVLLQSGVVSHTTGIPSSPSTNGIYIVPTGGTGAWSGKDGQLAVWRDSVWYFIQPRNGQVMYNTTLKVMIVYNGATWEEVKPNQNEKWFNAASGAINISNGSKQRININSSGNLSFTLNDGDDLTLRINPRTYTVSITNSINWTPGPVDFVADKVHTLVVSRDGSNYYGWWGVEE